MKEGKKIKMDLQDVLNEFSEMKRYNLSLPLLAKYGINALVQSGDYLYFEAFPDDVKKEIRLWIKDYRSTGEFYFLSSDGRENLSELMAGLVGILPD